MASTPEDEDSGTGSTTHSQESNVIKHIDRNILSCLICQQRFREPKVSKPAGRQAGRQSHVFEQESSFLRHYHVFIHNARQPVMYNVMDVRASIQNVRDEERSSCSLFFILYSIPIVSSCSILGSPLSAHLLSWVFVRLFATREPFHNVSVVWTSVNPTSTRGKQRTRA